MTTDDEISQLRAKVKELQTQASKHERAQRETARLKGIINNQQQQVQDTQYNSYCYRVRHTTVHVSIMLCYMQYKIDNG